MEVGTRIHVLLGKVITVGTVKIADRSARLDHDMEKRNV
jgi:hypothetical protein